MYGEFLKEISLSCGPIYNENLWYHSSTFLTKRCAWSLTNLCGFNLRTLFNAKNDRNGREGLKWCKARIYDRALHCEIVCRFFNIPFPRRGLIAALRPPLDCNLIACRCDSQKPELRAAELKKFGFLAKQIREVDWGKYDGFTKWQWDKFQFQQICNLWKHRAENLWK